jgi:hypothetical protein
MRSSALLVMVLGAVTACGSTDAASTARRADAGDRSRDPVGEVMPHEECVGSGGDVVAQDANHDGQPDIRTVMEGGRPRCREVDANFDGRIDIYRWFDVASGQTTRVEDDYDFDGRIDVVATFEGGVVARDILDTNFDGRTDTWRVYRGGQVVELRRDADTDGRVDTWERFDAEGRLTYAAHDNNHDGEPDAEPGQGDGGVTGDAATPPAATTPAATTPAATTPAATTPAATTPAATTPATPAQKSRGGHES